MLLIFLALNTFLRIFDPEKKKRMKPLPKNKLYNLVHYSGARKLSTEMWNQPIALVKWKKRVLKNTTHRMGDLRIEENITKAMKPRERITNLN